MDQTVTWAGPWDTTGYGEAYFRYVKAMVDHQPGRRIRTYNWSVFPDRQKDVDGATQDMLWKHSFDEGTTDSICIQQCIPELFNPIYSHNIGYTVWEAEGFPVRKVEMCNKMDEIWTASAWGKKVMEKAGVAVPIYVIPHIAEPLAKPDTWDRKECPTNFLWIGEFNHRKGWDVAMKAFLDEFGEDEDQPVILRMRTSGPNDIQRHIPNRRSFMPHIALTSGYMTSKQHLTDIQDCDCVIMSSRGEGWGLTASDAMWLGKPVIATDHTGNTEFMNAGNSILIPGKLTVVDEKYVHMVSRDPGYLGCGIYEPDVMALRRALRKIHTDPITREILGENAADDMRRLFSGEVVAQMVEDRLKEILG